MNPNEEDMNLRIIAVDDDKLMMELMERALAPFCSRFDKVTTLQDALSFVEANGYNICLLDLRLEETDKDDAFASIRGIKAHNCSVVIVTGMVEPGLEKQAKAAGADYFVRKDGPNFSSVLRTACAIAILHLPHDSFHSGSFLEHIRALRQTVAA